MTNKPKQRNVVICGVGHHLPKTILDNETLCETLDVTPEWVLDKTGIQTRYVAAPEDSASDFATRAAQNALKISGIPAEDIDLIIVCTFSGDYIFPPVSAYIHRELNCNQAQIFDLQANCTGFVTGLTVASDRIKCDPTIDTALVVGLEFCTRYSDSADVETAIYLGDGAGAAVLRSSDDDHGIMASSFYTDSSNFEAVRMRGGGSRFTYDRRDFNADIDFMEMNGIATWKQAITHLPGTIRSACKKADVELTEVDFVVFHQANLMLIDYLMRKMRIPKDKTYTNVEKYGNTGAASLAIALSEAVCLDKIKHDDLVILAAIGAGFNFGASVWKWNSFDKR